jgi:hypothetical protein
MRIRIRNGKYSILRRKSPFAQPVTCSSFNKDDSATATDQANLLRRPLIPLLPSQSWINHLNIYDYLAMWTSNHGTRCSQNLTLKQSVGNGNLRLYIGDVRGVFVWFSDDGLLSPVVGVTVACWY